MNTLSERGLRDRAVEQFHYPVIPRVGSTDRLELGAAGTHCSRDLALEQELAAAIEAARKKGFQEGQAQANAAAVQAIEQERSALTAAARDFDRQRLEYFRHVETETVRLALSIARKVLHREAQMDPLLLAGVVRVALDQLQAGTRLVLRTSRAAAPGWREFCATELSGDRQLEVVEDDALQPYQCVLQADIGTTEISVDTQLHEIENGFFDLLREDATAAP
jgi:flagellar assembly protein FliH